MNIWPEKGISDANQLCAKTPDKPYFDVYFHIIIICFTNHYISVVYLRNIGKNARVNQENKRAVPAAYCFVQSLKRYTNHEQIRNNYTID